MHAAQLAQPIRLQLKYLGIEFEDVHYVQGGREYIHFIHLLMVVATVWLCVADMCCTVLYMFSCSP